uniref:Uncharacterized protein n=1 Tax=Tanacetum cinerariifolium TaxID=118510 RepID=A0A6L2KQB3_TANCI|nr:hypothetical protein [Tanacetum cinerariifolium]
MAEVVVAKVEKVVPWREKVVSLLGEIPDDVMGERGRDTIEVDGGAISGSAGSICGMEPSFNIEGNRLPAEYRQ